jgi:hypothetical protein
VPSRSRLARQLVVRGLLGTMPGALEDARSLKTGAITHVEFGVHRAREFGLAVIEGLMASRAPRLGSTGSRTHTRTFIASRTVLTSVVVGGVSDLAVATRGDMSLRSFAQNRAQDAFEAGGSYLVVVLTGAALLAAPVEVPAAGASVALLVVGAGADRALRWTWSRAVGN